MTVWVEGVGVVEARKGECFPSLLADWAVGEVVLLVLNLKKNTHTVYFPCFKMSVLQKEQSGW